jgi:hypothetical protein
MEGGRECLVKFTELAEQIELLATLADDILAPKALPASKDL